MEQESTQNLSRRNFMKGALAAGVAATAAGLTACSPSSPSSAGDLAQTGSCLLYTSRCV